MANTELLPMHSDFARWHACIGLGDDEARRQSRWAGVSDVAQAADSKDIEVLIRLAFKSRQSAPAAQVQKIRQSFKTADSAFEMHGNDRELQVLAGASLAALMNKGDSTGAEAALARSIHGSEPGLREVQCPCAFQGFSRNSARRRECLRSRAGNSLFMGFHDGWTGCRE